MPIQTQCAGGEHALAAAPRGEAIEVDRAREFPGFPPEVVEAAARFAELLAPPRPSAST